MPEEFDIGLKAKLREFKNKFGIEESVQDQELFEQFVNYVIFSNMMMKDFENIDKVSTNRAQGIDGIGIIVNGQLMEEEQDLERLGENERLKVDIVFTQATIQSSFNSQKFSSFVDNVVNFLIGNLRIEPFSSTLFLLIDEEGDYIDKLVETPKLYLYYVSGKTTHQLDENSISPEKRKITERTELQNRFELKNIYFWQKDEIKSAYETIPRYHKIQIKLHNNTQLERKPDIEMSLLAAIKFSELKKLILNKDEFLKENLFIENPRYYLRETDVNIDIKKTLKDPDLKKYFVYLNNGLVILCEKIERHPTIPNAFYLTFPRIINGCQTTHILYEMYQENPSNLEEIEIISKIIATQDEDLKKKIIFAANNQNAISKDLQALNDFHKKIEEYFKGKEALELFYERLRGQYPSITPPYKKINIENMAKVYISIFLKEPHKMKSNAIKRIIEYQTKGKIFNHEHRVEDYYYCGMLFYWLNKFIINQKIKLKSKTMDMHLLLTCDLILLNRKGIRSTSDKINFLQDEAKALKLFKEANTHLETQEYLFERRGFYSSPKTKRS